MCPLGSLHSYSHSPKHRERGNYFLRPVLQPLWAPAVQWSLFVLLSRCGFGWEGFVLDPLGHVGISGLNVSWPPQYFPHVSMMEAGAGAIQLGSALCQVGKVCAFPVRGCCLSRLCQWITAKLGPILWIHISPWNEGWCQSRDCEHASWEIIWLCLFIYLFQPVTKMGEYLDGATPPRNCCLYFSLLSRVSHIWSAHSPAVVCGLCWHVLT